MVRSRKAEAWNHTSWLCAVVASYAFGSKGSRRPAEFNPLARKAPLVKLSPKASLDLLEATFPRKRYARVERK